MNAQEFYTHLEDALAASPGSIAPGQPLSSIPEWDSLAVMSVLALADSKYGKNVSPGSLKTCRNVDDLMGVIASA